MAMVGQIAGHGAKRNFASRWLGGCPKNAHQNSSCWRGMTFGLKGVGVGACHTAAKRVLQPQSPPSTLPRAVPFWLNRKAVIGEGHQGLGDITRTGARHHT